MDSSTLHGSVMDANPKTASPSTSTSHSADSVETQLSAAQYSFLRLKQDFHELRSSTKAKLGKLQDKGDALQQRSETLQRRNASITTFLVLVTLGWLSTTTLLGYQLYQQSQQVSATTSAPTLDAEERQRLKDLEQQVQELNTRLSQDLPLQLQQGQEQVRELAEQLRQVEIDNGALENLSNKIEQLGQKVTVPTPQTAPSNNSTISPPSDASAPSQGREDSFPKS